MSNLISAVTINIDIIISLQTHRGHRSLQIKKDKRKHYHLNKHKSKKESWQSGTLDGIKQC